MSDTKKQSFLHGTMLLAMSTAIVKVIGAFYSIPLNAIIGEQGFGYYSTAYEIYTLLLMISTAGLPVAMSRMISAATGWPSAVRKASSPASKANSISGENFTGPAIFIVKDTSGRR